MANDNLDSLSDEELFKRYQALKTSAPDNLDSLSDEELFKRYQAIKSDDDQQIHIAEKAPTPHEDFTKTLQGGLDAYVGRPVSQMAGNFAQGAAKGFQDLGNAGLTAMGMKPPPGAEPIDLTSDVHGAYKEAIESGQKEHPVLSAIAQGAGESTPTLPLWEAGAAGAASKLKFLQPVLQAKGPMSLLKAAGPEGNAMLQTLAKAPAAARILHTMATQGTGGFLSGMQEELTKEMSKGASGGQPPRPNVLKILQAGIERGTEASAIGGALHAAGETAIKSGAKILSMFKESTAKQAVKAREAYHQSFIDDIENAKKEAKATYDMQAKRTAEQQKNDTAARETAYKQRKAELEAQHDIERAEEDAKEQKLQANIKRAQDAAKSRKAAQQSDAETKRAAEQHAQELADYRVERARNEAARRKAAGAIDSRANMEGEKPTQSAHDAYAPSVSRTPQQMRNEQRARTREPEEQYAHVEPKPESTYKGGFIQPPKEKKLKLTAEPTPPVVPETPPSEPTGEKRPLEKAPIQPKDAPEFGSVYHTKKELQDVYGFSENEAKRLYKAQRPSDRATGKTIGVFTLKERAQRDVRTEYSAKQTEKGRNAFMPDEETDNAIDNAASYLTDLGAGPAAAFRWAGDVAKENGAKAVDVLAHTVAIIQRNSQIFEQYDNDLAVALTKAGESALAAKGSVADMFKNTRAKIKVSLFKAGDVATDVWIKGLRGTLSEEERAQLPANVLEHIDQARADVKEYEKETGELLDWLDENTKRGFFENQSSLGRLRKTLSLQRKELVGQTGAEEGNGDAWSKILIGAVTRGNIAYKAGISFMHAAEKGLVLGIKEGAPSLSKAIKGAYAGKHVADFTKNFIGDAPGAISESFEEHEGGLGKLKGIAGKVENAALNNPVGRVLTGRVIENAPNRVAAAMALQKAAKELGYASGDDLARDLNAMREGKGPLAFDTDKSTQAMRTIQDYVSDLTGLNVPGFRDSNVLQRNQRLRLFNMFMTARLIQSNNEYQLVRAWVNSKSPSEAIRRAGIIGAYAAGMYVIAGDKAPAHREGDMALKAAMGAPSYYHLRDMTMGARAMLAGGHQPAAMEHITPSVNPIAMNSGETGWQIFREAVHNAANAKGPDAVFKAATAVGMAIPGIGAAAMYAKAGRDAQRGYELLHAYGQGTLPGEENHVADIPIQVNPVEAIGKQYTHLVLGKEMEAIYNAQKTADLSSWVRDNADAHQFQQLKEREKHLPEMRQMARIKERQDRFLTRYRRRGLKDDSAEIQNLKTTTDSDLAQGDLASNAMKARAEYWQRAADQVMQQKQQKSSPFLPGAATGV